MRHSGLFLIVAMSMLAAPATPAQPERVDLVVVNGRVVTMNPGKEVISEGTVVIDEGRIVAVGDSQLARRFAADRRIDAGGDIVMPGMVNGHNHASMALFRGLGDDVADRLRRYMFPLEKMAIDAESVYRGARLAAVEMALGGVTTFADMYYFEDQVARAVKEVGLRGVLGETVIGFPAPDAAEPYGGLDYAKAFIDRYRGDELVIPALAPHAPYTVDTEHLRRVAEAAERWDVPVLTHLAETESEVDQVREQFGMTPVEYLDSVGLLDERLVAAHCIYVTDSDIDLMRRRGVGVSHNIVSNVKSAKAIAPALDMFDRGVRIGLGTDGPMSGNTIDIIGQLGYVAKLHKLANNDRTVMPAVKVVEMATMGGARALHLEDRIGSLEAGKLADVIVVDKDSVHMTPLYDVYSALVYAASPADVTTTIVHGRVVMENRAILTVDVEEVKRKVLELTEEIRKKADQL